MKEQEARGLLNNLMRVKIPILSDLPLLNVLWKYKNNAIVNKFFLGGDKFMLEMQLMQTDLHRVLVVHSLKIKKE